MDNKENEKKKEFSISAWSRMKKIGTCAVWKLSWNKVWFVLYFVEFKEWVVPFILNAYPTLPQAYITILKKLLWDPQPNALEILAIKNKKMHMVWCLLALEVFFWVWVFCPFFPCRSVVDIACFGTFFLCERI